MHHRISGEIRTCYNQDGAVVLDTRGNRIFNFNNAGAALLRILNCGTVSAEVLTKALADSHGIDPKLAAGDVSDFLEQLRSYGLIDSAEEPETKA
jgi:coenzyme PQQ synthesis protein D (PqqD)